MNAVPARRIFRRRPAARPRAASSARAPVRLARAPARKRKPRAVRPGVPRPMRPVIDQSMARAHFDALDKRFSLPSSDSVGEFLTVNCTSRFTVQTLAANPVYVIYQFTPTQVRTIVINGLTRNYVNVVNSQLTSAAPTSVRALRSSIRVRNTSVFTSVQGSIRTLSSPMQIDWTGAFPSSSVQQVSVGFLAQIAAAVTTNFGTTTLTGADFLTTQAVIVPPASNSGFKAWYQFALSASFAAEQQGFVSGSLTTVQNCVIMEFAPTPTSIQSFDCVAHEQVATRYSLNGLLSNLSLPPIAIDSATEHALVQAMQVDASRPVPADSIPAGAVYPQKAARAMPYGH